MTLDGPSPVRVPVHAGVPVGHALTLAREPNGFSLLFRKTCFSACSRSSCETERSVAARSQARTRSAARRWRSSGRRAAAAMTGCAPGSTPPSTPSAAHWRCTRTCGRPLAFLLCCPCTTSPWPLYASSLSQLVAKAFVSTRPGPGRSGALASRSRTCPCTVQNAWLSYSIQRFVFL